MGYSVLDITSFKIYIEGDVKCYVISGAENIGHLSSLTHENKNLYCFSAAKFLLGNLMFCFLHFAVSSQGSGKLVL